MCEQAQPLFRDPKKFPDMADPLLNKQFPEKDLNQAVAIAAMCLQEEAAVRPFMSDVVTTLSFLSTSPPPPAPVPVNPTPGSENHDGNSECVSDDEEGSDNESIRSSDNNCRHCADDNSDNEGNGKNLRQGTGTESKEWLSFGHDGSDSSGDHISTSKSNKGDQHTNSSSQEKYGSVTSRSTSADSTEEGVSHSNNRVTQSEESTVTLGGISSTASSDHNLIEGYSKSLTYLDRTTSKREPKFMNVPPIKSDH